MVEPQEVIKQLEYYMSDKNLSYDEFFYTEIQNNSDRYLSLS